ncbi:MULTISPECIES: prepilin-type N-terminal cleavage/methylation domain-containing protein [unclassified Acinetobacter]|uniref:prepilin-type N-terminal cleavage/methylation domain-containing protein n=1 Tax=unclassified Acinetobacter TaxID=196816 RepID=UPI0029352745|nr:MULTISPECIES: prepilin-type N-terminal cleavage/methylation domain-containing protein [unclassified Acinetobacter]WOE32063.1 prepilin-type N-terminal cleavage/methylation domain-containing protein [Acinetobacter sp. SAAs470]WOE37532.1 prepilin-type N-terminal cleavage/methylation domain-containing protein [Acinetobacter sp. SAAs474]
MMPSSIRGFTLVELMVVIVIVAMLASLILLSNTRVDERKAMQAREVLLLDIQRLTQESQDQSKVLALAIQQSQNHDQYHIVEYQPLAKQQQAVLLNSASDWVPYSSFKTRELPDGVSLRVYPQEEEMQSRNRMTSVDSTVPALVWWGNGEIKPVTIQFFYQQKPIGAEIKIDYLGHMNES